jgi:pSer/pThr/pTyr-binding forkhead associated (FHA) protein
VSVGARIVWQRADGERLEFPLEGDTVVVGRDDEVGVCIDEPLVSRQHARLERRGESWALVDLGSTNGTRVNGDVVARERVLEDGDELRFARATCVFLSGSDGAPPGIPPR